VQLVFQSNKLFRLADQILVWTAKILYHHFSKATGGVRELPLSYIKALKTLSTDCCWAKSISAEYYWFSCESMMDKGSGYTVLCKMALRSRYWLGLDWPYNWMGHYKDNQHKDNIATLHHAVSFIPFFVKRKQMVPARMEKTQLFVLKLSLHQNYVQIDREAGKIQQIYSLIISTKACSCYPRVIAQN